MGLLDKTNPAATRESVIRHAWISGVLGAVACTIYCRWRQVETEQWPLIAALAGLVGGALGALLEWQMDDGNELCHVARKVEAEFGIDLSDDWETWGTVDDLFQATLASLRWQNADALNQDAVWERLKRVLVEFGGWRPELVVPSAEFYIDLRM